MMKKVFVAVLNGLFCAMVALSGWIIAGLIGIEQGTEYWVGQMSGAFAIGMILVRLEMLK